MEQSDIDFSYLNDAIKEDEIIKSKGKIQPNASTESRIQALMHDVKILAENKIPLDIKGNPPN